MWLFVALVAAFAAAFMSLAGGTVQPAKQAAPASLVRAVSATPTPSPGGQMGSPMPGPTPTGRPSNTAPTPTPSGMGGGAMGTPSAKPTPAAHTGNGPSERLSVPLQTMPAGTVTLSVDPQTRLVVAQLNLFGLAPGTQHRIALYRDRDGGRPLVTFPDVTADGSGQLAQTVTSAGPARGGLPRDPYFQLDLQQSGQPQQQIAVAHAPIARTGANHVTLAFASTIARPAHATLAYDPATHQLTVSLQVNGLVPGSHHAAHIHAGSCRVQGAVLYPLPDLVANAGGSASEQVTIPVQSAPPATGWYVNVHDGTMNNILQANGQPGPLFQPLVCGNVQGRPAHS